MRAGSSSSISGIKEYKEDFFILLGGIIACTAATVTMQKPRRSWSSREVAQAVVALLSKVMTVG